MIARRNLIVFPPLIMLLLVLGISGGLLRSGVEIRSLATAVTWHGALMVAFFTTVVSLERAVAYARWPALLVPLAAASAGVLLLAGQPTAGQLLLLLAAVGQPILYLKFWKMSRELHVILQALAPFFLAAGIVAWWCRAAVSAAVDGWMLYLVWTIAGERLDLQRLARPSPAILRILVGLYVASLVAVFLQPWTPTLATQISALVLALVALWLLRFDIARRTVKIPGQTRYIALALLTGYGWLLFGALLRFGYPQDQAGSIYDAALHAVWLGFVFSMVFGHLPVILPALSGARFLWHKLLYAPLGVLHGSLAVRVVGDLTGNYPLRQWGGILGAVAIAMFLVVALARVRRPYRPSTITTD